MSLRNTHQTYGGIAKSLHWIIFIAFVIMYGIGYYMVDLPLGPEMFEKIALHKSIGMLILGAALLRLIWRFLNPQPSLPDDMPAIQKVGAHVSHIALYVVMFAMPLTGWAMSSAANFPVSVFGWFTLPNIMDPSKEAVETLKTVHWALSWFILFLVGAHILAALKHHFINKDSVLVRMMPFHSGD